MSIHRLAIVMPAYNEAEGIRGFIDELREAVTPLAEEVSFHIADDRSTDATPHMFDDVADVTVDVQPENRGHGPTALAAYRLGLATDPEIIVHVDGDGQFLGSDFRRLVDALVRENADVVHGIRDGRTDPWYRKVLTGSVGTLIAFAAGRRVPDVNTPLRAYRPAALRALVDAVPTTASVPHVHFSLAEARAGFRVRYVRVTSVPRRGESTQGTMWGHPTAMRLPPRRLRQFAASALGEVWRLSLRPSAPLRNVGRERSSRS